MSRQGVYDFDPADGLTYRLGLPPIVGSDGGSAWFGGGHASFDQSVVPPKMVDGFSLLIDLQPDRPGEQTVLGVERSTGSALWLTVDSNDVPGSVQFEVRDEMNQTLLVRAAGSVARARRIAITAIPRVNRVDFYELQAWSERPGEALVTETIRADSPDDVLLDSFVVAGLTRDGVTEGTFEGRLAEVAIFDKVLPVESIQRLRAASGNPTNLQSAALGNPTPELADTFLRMARRLRRLAASATFGAEERDDAALLLYSWLFSQRPMLPRLAEQLGIQLWLPGRGSPLERYPAPVELSGEWIQLLAAPDVDSPAFGWMTLDQWRNHAAFRVGNPEHSVSREAFVKFVRNKLGWGHFDEDDRAAWQVRLLNQAGGFDIAGMDALVFQMQALVREVTLALSASRVEPALRQLLI